MNVVLTYDVNTETKAGQKRLRQVAKACEGYGQRVQDSVFECTISATEMERFRIRLLKIIDPQIDSLRIYRLHPDRGQVVEVHGVDLYQDFSEPLIV
jgi:CRISPR-associated protein Cas2